MKNAPTGRSVSTNVVSGPSSRREEWLICSQPHEDGVADCLSATVSRRSRKREIDPHILVRHRLRNRPSVRKSGPPTADVRSLSQSVEV